MSDDSHNGAPWTPEEVAKLKSLAAEGLTAAGIADRMSRSRAGIVKKAGLERLSLNPHKSAG